MEAAQTIGVVGAGTMGLGIAEIALLHGDAVLVFDSDDRVLSAASERIRRALEKRLEKGALSVAERDAAALRLRTVSALDDFHSCDFVFEAVREEIAAKAALFQSLAAVTRHDCLLASNTSSLSISALGAASGVEQRVCGLHFFNPAPAMPLVEVIAGLRSDPSLVSAGEALVRRWGKTTIRAKDTPGFLVNRVARPFYGESLLILEQGSSFAPTIDHALRTIGGFKMGPFELMDLIGLDVNYAVTTSVFEQTGNEPRYRPSPLQKLMVEAGQLGRKSGRGFYDYQSPTPPPTVTADAAHMTSIFERVLTTMINEAVFAVESQIATPSDIDVAMTKGTNYPKGLLAWGAEIGWSETVKRLEALQTQSADARYRPSSLILELAAGRASLATFGS